MLVLSRRVGEQIVFPSLGITVELLQTKGNSVRIGVNAPPDVRIVRSELVGQSCNSGSPLYARANHELRGRLNTMSIALSLIEKQIQAGLTNDATQTLHEVMAMLESMELALPRADAPSRPRPKDAIETLLVEDDPNEQALLSSYLRLNGFNVSVVQDGYQALEYLATHKRPDFILLDMRLPRFDGPSTVSAIRQNPSYRDLTVFAVTGCKSEDFRIPIGRTGVNAWFQKPLNPARIVEAMTQAASKN